MYIACASVIESMKPDPDETVDDENLLELDYIKGMEKHTDAKINAKLTTEQVREEISEFKEVFTENPGLTNLAEHKIPLC